MTECKIEKTSMENRKIAGNEDQRYVTQDDRDAAKKWFEKQARAQDKRWTRQDRRENLARLTREIDRLVIPKFGRK